MLKCCFFLNIFTGVFDKNAANHVLINEYLPGQGIMPHTDGPLFYPIISTISCGSHTVLEFTASPASTHQIPIATDNNATTNSPKRLLQSKTSSTETIPDVTTHRKVDAFKLMVERRSLLILQDDVYDLYMHSIAERDSDLITDDILNLQQCCDERSLGTCVQRDKRVSLTIRHVPKTSKLKLHLGRR